MSIDIGPELIEGRSDVPIVLIGCVDIITQHYHGRIVMPKRAQAYDTTDQEKNPQDKIRFSRRCFEFILK